MRYTLLSGLLVLTLVGCATGPRPLHLRPDPFFIPPVRRPIPPTLALIEAETAVEDELTEADAMDAATTRADEERRIREMNGEFRINELQAQLDDWRRP
jgi:hypothetical protein